MPTGHAHHTLPFRCALWGEEEVTFDPMDTAPSAPFAVVVFAVCPGGYLIGRPPRGWTSPSGHVEPGETPEMAARRETWEEVGAQLGRLLPLGSFRLVNRRSGPTRYAAAFIAPVVDRGPIPADSESTGARVFGRHEIADAYWRWDGLLEDVFAWAELHRLGVLAQREDASD